MNALQKQREHVQAVRERLGRAPVSTPVVYLVRPPKAEAKPVKPRAILVCRWPMGPRRIAKPSWSTVAKGLMQSICEEHGVDPGELVSSSRITRTVHARHHLMWALRKHTGWGTPRIAAFLGVDHSTVIHGARRHEQRMQEAGQ